jgi:hypothetical protein
MAIVVALAVINLSSDSGFPAAKFTLMLPKTLIDGRFELAQDLSDSKGKELDRTSTRDSKITDWVVGQYNVGGDQTKGVLVLSGMYGRFKNADASRKSMLKGAAEADGATVAVGPKNFTQSGSPMVSCEVLSQEKSGKTLIYPVCAWTDDNTGAIVGVTTPKSTAQEPSTLDLQFYAKFTLQVRSETMKAIE